nr:glycosyltransferase family 2 protein [Microbacterium hydrocarbonoxydans]
MPSPQTVAVVIPARDDARLLARCLDALSEQTRPPDEVIVVDDGSTDDTARTARAFDARVVRLDGEGIPSASAAGYDAATADIICRLDADSVPPPRWLAVMAGELEERPELVALSGTARSVDGPEPLRAIVPVLYLGAYRLILTPTLGHPPLFASALALRADAWRAVRHEVHRGDPQVHDDLDLAFHLGAVGRIAFRTGIPVGISSRSFRGLSSSLVRVRRGFHTVLVHWPRDFPPLRWFRLRRNSQRAHSPGGPKRRIRRL